MRVWIVSNIIFLEQNIISTIIQLLPWIWIRCCFSTMSATLRSQYRIAIPDTCNLYILNSFKWTWTGHWQSKSGCGVTITMKWCVRLQRLGENWKRAPSEMHIDNQLRISHYFASHFLLCYIWFPKWVEGRNQSRLLFAPHRSPCGNGPDTWIRYFWSCLLSPELVNTGMVFERTYYDVVHRTISGWLRMYEQRNCYCLEG